MAFLFIKLDKSLLADHSRCIDYVNATVQQNVPRMVTVGTPVKFTCKIDSGDGIVSAALNGTLSQPNLASQETVKNELSKFSKEEKAVYDRKTNCFLNSVVAVKDPIFQPGEKLEKEWFTYLESWFGNYPKGTAAFIRETNFSHQCFLITHVYLTRSLSSTKLVFEVRRPLESKWGSQAKSSPVKDMAKEISKGLLGGGITGQIGALIFKSIFPPSVPSYFEEVYEEIEKIMKKELTQQVIDQINGSIDGFQRWINDEYDVLKESGQYTKEELTNLLRGRMDDQFIESMGILTYGEYAVPGICTFMISAGMHFTMLQELAYIDPKASPESSAWVESLKKYADDYVLHAQTTVDDIVNTRRDNVIHKNETYHDPGSSIFYNSYWWEDLFTGEKSQIWHNDVDKHGEEDPHAVEKRDKDMQAHKDAVKHQLLEDMSNPYSTIDDWRQLKDQPLPKV